MHVTHLFNFQYFFLIKIFQNKFYIESKLNRDLSEELMKLFADHVAEKHVNTLMRECTPSFGPDGLEKMENASEFLGVFCSFPQRFSSELIPCLFMCSQLQWLVWLKVSTALDQVSYEAVDLFTTFLSVLRMCCAAFHFLKFGLFPSEWARLAPALFSGFIPQINPPALESLLPAYAADDQKLQLDLSMNGFPRSVFRSLFSLRVYFTLIFMSLDFSGFFPPIPSIAEPNLFCDTNVFLTFRGDQSRKRANDDS